MFYKLILLLVLIIISYSFKTINMKYLKKFFAFSGDEDAV
jgi:hypothetical protein